MNYSTESTGKILDQEFCMMGKKYEKAITTFLNKNIRQTNAINQSRPQREDNKKCAKNNFGGNNFNFECNEWTTWDRNTPVPHRIYERFCGAILTSERLCIC